MCRRSYKLYTDNDNENKLGITITYTTTAVNEKKNRSERGGSILNLTYSLFYRRLLPYNNITPGVTAVRIPVYFYAHNIGVKKNKNISRMLLLQVPIIGMCVYIRPVQISKSYSISLGTIIGTDMV